MVKNKLNSLNAIFFSEKATASIIFALLIPLIITLYAFCIDASNLMVKRARTAEAHDEAVIAVIATDNRDLSVEDKLVNRRMVINYINYYLPGNAVALENVSITVGNPDAGVGDVINYNISSKIRVDSIISSKDFQIRMSGFDDEILLTSEDTNSGFAEKQIATKISDIALVVDFSRSMGVEKLNDGRIRINALKQVINQIVDVMAPEAKLTIVPYDIGVPVLLDGENPAGGQQVGCSVLFEPKTEYRINYDFWADKYVDANTKSISSLWDERHVLLRMDEARYTYYKDVVLPAIDSKNDMQTLVNKGLCTYNAISGIVVAKAQYSCGRDSIDRIHNTQSLSRIRAEYGKVVSNLRNIRPEIETKDGLNMHSIFNINTAKKYVEFDKPAYPLTSADIITFTIPWAPNTFENRMFSSMCQSVTSTTPAGTPTHNRFKEQDAYQPNLVVKEKEANKLYSNSIAGAKPGAFMINLTNDRKLLAQFQDMKPNGGTHTLSGLIRSVPELQKGTNDHRIIIMVSDGAESVGLQDITNQYVRDGICQKIIEQLSENNKAALIYYISLAGNSAENDARVAFWGEHCTTLSNAVAVSNIDQLLRSIASFSGIETGVFINKKPL